MLASAITPGSSSIDMLPCQTITLRARGEIQTSKSLALRVRVYDCCLIVLAFRKGII
jgi:hypothetical protein